MARFAAFFLLALFATISVRVKGNSCSYYASVPGGCPDIKACIETCVPCYAGIGRIVAECVTPGAGGIYWWSCRCNFVDGAPCPPNTGFACPGPPSRARQTLPALAHNWVILNQTHAQLVGQN